MLPVIIDLDKDVSIKMLASFYSYAVILVMASFCCCCFWTQGFISCDKKRKKSLYTDSDAGRRNKYKNNHFGPRYTILQPGILLIFLNFISCGCLQNSLSIYSQRIHLNTQSMNNLQQFVVDSIMGNGALYQDSQIYPQGVSVVKMLPLPEGSLKMI